MKKLLLCASLLMIACNTKANETNNQEYRTNELLENIKRRDQAKNEIAMKALRFFIESGSKVLIISPEGAIKNDPEQINNFRTSIEQLCNAQIDPTTGTILLPHQETTSQVTLKSFTLGAAGVGLACGIFIGAWLNKPNAQKTS